MSKTTYPVPTRVSANSPSAIADMADWREQWMAAETNPDGFWLARAHEAVHWRTAPTEGLKGTFQTVKDAPLTWFADGTLNVSETCLDQHLSTRADKAAIIWEADEPGTGRTLTYAQLHAEVCRAAGALQSMGVSAGDRVIIYMGMVPEAAIAMLACARVGAIHSVVFGGFSAEALRDRVIDCKASAIITQDEGQRGGRTFALKAVVDEALDDDVEVDLVLVYRRTGGAIDWTDGRDVWWHEAVDGQTSNFEATEMKAEDPLFILYTSGSTGRPKGLVHTCGGYLTYTAYTHRTVFDLREDDVYACVADVGWITGHSYIVYGPLANGATTVMFESTPLYPDAGRYWDLVARHKVTIFYTAPTAIRALAAQGDALVKAYDRSSLRVLGTVGEPINPDAWIWYQSTVGEGRCTIVDTWWQTETGGIAISPIAPATPVKPGSATRPLPGIQPILMHPDGHVLRGPAMGHLCLAHPWPGQARTVWGNHARFVGTYFETYPGLYFTGDGCRRDADGDYWITGRVDDVLNVSGHRMGTAEFESALVSLDTVAEAAVVGFPHPIKGQGVFAYIVAQGATVSIDLSALNAALRHVIGAHARLDRHLLVLGLPKTRSGKVMRRILRKIAAGESENLGDISTLADPSVVRSIVNGAEAADYS